MSRKEKKIDLLPIPNINSQVQPPSIPQTQQAEHSSNQDGRPNQARRKRKKDITFIKKKKKNHTTNLIFTITGNGLLEDS